MEEDIFCVVWMVTYNHEKYIAKAIDSVLNQKTNFNFKILMGDDHSSDNTTSICRNYADKYPNKFELRTNSENLTAHRNGLATYYRCFKSKAKYIAMLEGDDYWLDDNKLQTQIDYLEKHPEYVGCFHNTEERYEDDDNKSSFLYCNYPAARNISFADLSYGNLIPTCSVVFRNNLFEKFPDWYSELKMGDWPLHLLNAQFGDYWYIPKVMAVHRLHGKSLWMLQDADRNRQYVSRAYDIMVKNFRISKIQSDNLMAGQKRFDEGMKLGKNNVNFKGKIKNYLLRIIGEI